MLCNLHIYETDIEANLLCCLVDVIDSTVYGIERAIEICNYVGFIGESLLSRISSGFSDCSS